MRKPNYSFWSKMALSFSIGCLVVFILAYIYVDDVNSGLQTLVENILTGIDLL